ncbi:MAG: hypothetical protein ACRDQZ_09670, partial [Mycobacteriales bacterium]
EVSVAGVPELAEPRHPVENSNASGGTSHSGQRLIAQLDDRRPGKVPDETRECDLNWLLQRV